MENHASQSFHWINLPRSMADYNTNRRFDEILVFGDAFVKPNVFRSDQVLPTVQRDNLG